MRTIRKVAAINVITFVGAKFDALWAELKALEAKFDSLRWMMGLIVILLVGILAALMTLIAMQLREQPSHLHGGEAQVLAPTTLPVETATPEPISAAPATGDSDNRR